MTYLSQAKPLMLPLLKNRCFAVGEDAQVGRISVSFGKPLENSRSKPQAVYVEIGAVLVLASRHEKNALAVGQVLRVHEDWALTGSNWARVAASPVGESRDR